MTGAVSPEAPLWLWLHAEDNVAMALSDFTQGSAIEVGDTRITFADDIAYGHKFAVRRIAAEAPVIKFAETIGVAKRNIDVGEHVHVHNISSLRAGKQ
ncbi:UxaA family hydrolase [Aurantimonas sp. A3-2-R12]|uniref:UxaA family hydrolase n=1 Tax=Aurantimonas sp. A3-2-R12 TaxID=3114362 RepID=UPI002E17D902|nr:UxaA family hydrolase [Aurantimonas sp. A3-2-R12]